MRRSVSRQLAAWSGILLALGLVVGIGGAFQAFYTRIQVCDSAEGPLGGVTARLVDTRVVSFVPAAITCTWDHRGELVEEYTPVNQAGQLVGAAAVGAGAVLAGLAVSRRRGSQ